MDSVEYRQVDLYFCGSDFIKTLYCITYESKPINTLIGILYNTADNTIEYTYSFNLMVGNMLQTFESLPEIISIDTLEDDDSGLAKMVYSHTEYFKYLVTQKITLEKLVKQAASRIETVLKECDEPMNIRNCLQAGIDSQISVLTSHMYLVNLVKKYMNTRIRLNIIFEFPSDGSKVVKYKYELFNYFTAKTKKPDDIFEIEIPKIEFNKSNSQLCGRLLQDYHILDNLIKQEMIEVTSELGQLEFV